MKVWIVTPSFNQLELLKRAVASVADQPADGLEVHHHVQDGGSTDGTREYLSEYLTSSQGHNASGYSFSFESAKDEGMYDAINRGWEKTPSDYAFIAYINCDEQYLPGALSAIARFFSDHPEAEIVLAGNIVVDGEGKYLCHRRAVMPFLWSARLWTASSACSTFMKRSVFFEKGGKFDTRWSIVGDMVWYVHLLEKKPKIRISTTITSIFADDGKNLATTSRGISELEEYKLQCLGWTARFAGLARQINTLRRIIADTILEKPKEYSIYRSGEVRERIAISKPTNLWRRTASK